MLRHCQGGCWPSTGHAQGGDADAIGASFVVRVGLLSINFGAEFPFARSVLTCCARVRTHPHTYIVYHTIVNLQSERGVLGLFPGMLSPLLVRGFLNAWLFAVFDASQRRLLVHRQMQSTLSFCDFAVCGAVAGLASAPLSSPMEDAIASATRSNRCKRGVSGGRLRLRCMLCARLACGARGLEATVVRETPAYAAYYSVYFYGKRALNATFPGGALDAPGRRRDGRRPRVLERLLSNRRCKVDHAGASARQTVARTLSHGVGNAGARNEAARRRLSASGHRAVLFANIGRRVGYIRDVRRRRCWR
jgi:hypothetical protein